MKPPANCGEIDSGSEAESWWRVPTGCHVVTRSTTMLVRWIRLSLLLSAFSFPFNDLQRDGASLASALKALNREIILRASDREVNAPEETYLEVVRHVAAVRPTPRRWINVRAVI